jgi:hypothetical protein
MLGLRRGSAIDTVARGLASGLSRREALKAGGAVVVGAVVMTPGDAWAAVTITCPKGTVRCGTRCVNLQTNARNCGRCGHVCPVGGHCTAGHCACPVGDAVCSAACVALAHDPKNCGFCGHVCRTNQVCSGGHCLTACPSGETNCSNACVNLQTNVHNCGRCGHACPGGATCTSGVCKCPSGKTACTGACVDLTSDNNNCGSCGHACGSGHVCSQSVCQPICSQGQTNCGGSCVDTTSDPNHCGNCSTQCTVMNGTAACSAGQCGIASCTPPYTNCDGHYSSGCNVNLNTDWQNCGRCGNVCSGGVVGSPGVCQNGMCELLP